MCRCGAVGATEGPRTPFCSSLLRGSTTVALGRRSRRRTAFGRPGEDTCLRPEPSRAILDNHDYRKGGHRHHPVSAVPISSAVPHRTLSTRITDPHAFAAAVSARRDHWLAQGLCTRPSDRPAAESAVAELYRRAGFEEPEFVWVPSPPTALQLIADEGFSVPPLRFGEPAHPSAGIAAIWSASRDRMDARTPRRQDPLLRAAV